MKKLFAKLITCFIFPKTKRKQIRKFLINFSFIDYFYYKSLNYKIVSLGDFCLPRVITTLTKLKPPKIYGEKSCPFDLCFHTNMSKITECINTNFKNYTENIEYDNKKQIYINKAFNAEYNHETEKTLQEVKKIYEKRITNFKNIVNTKQKIYFIYSTDNIDNYTDSNDIKNLYNSLKKIRKSKPFELILIIPKEIKSINNKQIHQIIMNWDINTDDWVGNFQKCSRSEIVDEKIYKLYKYLEENLKKIIINN